MNLHVGIIDDDYQFIKFFNEQISQIDGCQFTPIGNSLSEVLESPHFRDTRFDIIFLDIMMPGLNGIDGINQLKLLYPMSKIVMLTIMEDEEYLLKALCSGAEGYLLKNFTFPELKIHIETILKGGAIISASMARYIVNYFGPKVRPDGAVLTEKNLQVLHLLAEGWAYKTIADRMGISIDGVRYHIKEIYRALGVQSTAQAVRKYILGDLPSK